MSDCPRCQAPLATGQLDAIEVRLCQGCRGFLLPHPDLTQIIEGSWRAVSRATAEQMTFRSPAGWQTERRFPCPDCRQPMDKYGYLGLAAIQIDRCDKCALVWLDADELQNMVLALAQTNYRTERSREAVRDTLDLGAAGLRGVESGPPSSWLFADTARQLGNLTVPRLLRLLLR